MNELDDLGNLFEFGDIDLNNIPDVDSGNYGGEQMQQPHSQHGTHPNTPFHDMTDPSLLPGSAVADFAPGQEQMGMMQGIDQQGQRPHHFMGPPTTQMPTSNAYIPDSLYQPAVTQPHQPKEFHFNGHQGYPPASHIPPTPNSYEMHGRAGSFMSHQQQQQYYRATMEQQRYQMQKDPHITFTPMASPTGTPQFHMLPEFTAPGAYFSPLSSPMLHAQNGQHNHAHPQGYVSHPNTAPSSAAPSPNDGNLDVDMGGNSQELPNRRKSRRKIATPKSVAANARAKSSPAPKAQKRKTSAKVSDNDLRRAVTSQPSSTSLRYPDSSEADSVSPEPLGESRMGPPPRPGSNLAQSASSGEQQQGAEAQAASAAATPKSLLQRRGAQQLTNGQSGTSQITQSAGDVGGLDDLALPEAARPTAPAPINTQIATAEDEGETPRMSARKTPKLDATSTPSSARPPSALASPAVGPSPATNASTPAAILKDKKDAKGGRGGKKRGSVSQTGSKNLPRISPSIKPLLPEGSEYQATTPQIRFNHVLILYRSAALINSSSAAGIKIQLPESLGRQPPPRRLIPRFPLNRAHIQTNLAQSR